ncbi:MAG TPA: 50S ribosomal protein L29 [Candidatus Saccharimonadales bacterium]|nr:50S ribosomal protein L29 [Candidatus Saccharimonadales bacterium]
MIKLRDIAEKTDAELELLINEQRARLAQIALELRTKKVTHVKEAAGAKRTIARALTIKRQRQTTQLENQQ